jgi:hypothetical protein
VSATAGACYSESEQESAPGFGGFSAHVSASVSCDGYGAGAGAGQNSFIGGDELSARGGAGGSAGDDVGGWAYADGWSGFDVEFLLTRYAGITVIADVEADASGPGSGSASTRLHDDGGVEYFGLHVSAGAGTQQEHGETSLFVPAGGYALRATASIDASAGEYTGSGASGDYAVRLIVHPEGDANLDGIVDVSDLLTVLEGWGACSPAPAVCDGDVNGDGVVDVVDLVLVLGTWDEQACSASYPLIVEEYVGEGWMEHGFGELGLTAYRIYAAFDEVGDDGVLLVFGSTGSRLAVTSSDGLFHNDEMHDSLTAPEDLTGSGYWSNQWDTYVTIGTDDALGDATEVSPEFGEETDWLRTSFEIENAGWYVRPEDEQSRSRDGRVLLGQFVVRERLTGAVLNLLLRDMSELRQVEFDCVLGP